jgi:hypothetical protein
MSPCRNPRKDRGDVSGADVVVEWQADPPRGEHVTRPNEHIRNRVNFCIRGDPAEHALGAEIGRDDGGSLGGDRQADGAGGAHAGLARRQSHRSL